MSIFVPNENVKSDISYGQAINKIRKRYIDPELKRRKIDAFKAAGVEILLNGKHRVYLDNEVRLLLEFKKQKMSPSDKGKAVKVDLHDIQNLKWSDPKLTKDSVKILVLHFNDNWWIYWADFKKRNDMEEKFKVKQTFAIRGGGYMPLSMRKGEKAEFMQGYRLGLEHELPMMWRRYITISQRYTGIMVYDGNYFDLFVHAQELYVLGYYYSCIIICRGAAEQALITILTNAGQAFETYRITKKGRKEIKGIKELLGSCKDRKIFPTKKCPINKISDKKALEISYIAGGLVHPQHDLGELEIYKQHAVKCMDNLQYIIKNHLNFIKDTGVVSGYRMAGSSKRLR